MGPEHEGERIRMGEWIKLFCTETRLSHKVGACVHLLVPAKSMKSFIYMDNKDI